MLLMAAAPSTLAAHGAWSGTAAGPQLSVGKQTYAGQALRSSAPLPPDAALSRISWRITLLTPPPPGLEIKLCSVTACIPLDRLTGQKAVPLPFSPNEELRFIYAVNAPGQLKPPIRVVSNQITVNYHWPNRSDR
ncbi:hypothetical protein GCM10007905_02600 [Mixta theicola]|nr:hypothetical protein GCM10007905_02600 [Mixta theicola]